MILVKVKYYISVNPKIALHKKINDVLLQVMETMKTLNKEHREILKKFDKRIDRFIYDVTDEYEYEAFKNFIPLKQKVLKLHNMLGSDITSDVGRNEWIFMLPNYLLFGAIGFSTALKNNDNADDIDDMCNELFTYMTKTVRDLDRMLNEFELDEDARDAFDYAQQYQKKQQQ